MLVSLCSFLFDTILIQRLLFEGSAMRVRSADADAVVFVLAGRAKMHHQKSNKN